jgi:AcrR family transcriptional regulator
MVRGDWVLGGERRALAAERIYSAAAELIVRHGMDAFDIDTLADRVHCSRATIYRYAGGKAQIRDAVVMRMAGHIVETVRRAVDQLSGPERVVTAITVALNQIRADPMRRLMLDATPPRVICTPHRFWPGSPPTWPGSPTTTPRPHSGSCGW